MATTLTVKGQVTIPKRIRDALKLAPGSRVEFDVNPAGQVVIQKTVRAGRGRLRSAVTQNGDPSRFERMLGRATVKWRTDELMALLRGE